MNNDCYARSAVKAGLHKHILHASYELHKHIVRTIANFEKLSSESTFGWESETSFPKVSFLVIHTRLEQTLQVVLMFFFLLYSFFLPSLDLVWFYDKMFYLLIKSERQVLGDVIESLAGAILLDSGYNKETVFKSIRPLLEPLVSPETVKPHPVKELTELCQRMHYDMRKPVKSHNNGVTSITIEVEANGMSFKYTSLVSDKRIAKKIACKEVLKSLKESIPL